MSKEAELVGVWKTLAAQHDEVAALLKRAKGDPDQLTELWPTIRRELLSHEKGEVREVYPLLRANDKTRRLAEHHDEEATEMEQMIMKIDGRMASDERMALFERLADTVIHHADEEETEIFPEAQEVLGKAKSEALDEPFLLAKQQVAESV